MLIRNYVGAAAQLVACLAYSVVKFVVLGSSEVFVKTADLLNNLTSVQRQVVLKNVVLRRASCQ